MSLAPGVLDQKYTTLYSPVLSGDKANVSRRRYSHFKSRTTLGVGNSGFPPYHGARSGGGDLSSAVAGSSSVCIPRSRQNLKDVNCGTA